MDLSISSLCQKRAFCVLCLLIYLVTFICTTNIHSLVSLALKILKFMPCFQFKCFVSYLCLLESIGLPCRYNPLLLLCLVDSSFDPVIVLR